MVEHVSLVVGGVPYPFDTASHDAIDLVWPNSALTLSPAAADWIGRWWGMFDDHTVLLAPTPDAAYQAQVTGLFQPMPISAANPSTYLSRTYPELLTAACLVWLSGALKQNYGAQADDPKMAMSWEQTYQGLLGPAKAEEMRRRGLAPDNAAAKA